MPTAKIGATPPASRKRRLESRRETVSALPSQAGQRPKTRGSYKKPRVDMRLVTDRGKAAETT